MDVVVDALAGIANPLLNAVGCRTRSSSSSHNKRSREDDIESGQSDDSMPTTNAKSLSSCSSDFSKDSGVSSLQSTVSVCLTDDQVDECEDIVFLRKAYKFQQLEYKFQQLEHVKLRQTILRQKKNAVAADVLLDMTNPESAATMAKRLGVVGGAELALAGSGYNAENTNINVETASAYDSEAFNKDMCDRGVSIVPIFFTAVVEEGQRIVDQATAIRRSSSSSTSRFSIDVATLVSALYFACIMSDTLVTSLPTLMRLLCSGISARRPDDPRLASNCTAAALMLET